MYHHMAGFCRPLKSVKFNPLNAKLNPVCHLLALLGAHHIFHVSRVRVKVQNIKDWNFHINVNDVVC